MTIKVGTTTLSQQDYDHRDFFVNSLIKDFHKIKVPEKMMRGISETYFQGSLGSCTAMGTTHSMKVQNEFEYKKKLELDWKDLRAKMGHSITKYDGGDSVENAVKTALRLGINGSIDGKPFLFKSDARGYGKWDSRRQALQLFPLITVIYGNSNTWKEMLDGEVKTIMKRNASSLGHAVLLVGYDNERVYFYNSFGDRINKGGISNFKISRANFDKAIVDRMINRRWFTLMDKKEWVDYALEIELCRQAIKPLKKLYEIGDDEVKKFLEQTQFTLFFEKKYGFQY